MGYDQFDVVFFFESKSFIRRRIWKICKEKLPEYETLVTNPAGDSVVQYFLNDVPLANNNEMQLSSITEEAVKQLLVIKKSDLAEQYRMEGKQIGINIKTLK